VSRSFAVHVASAVAILLPAGAAVSAPVEDPYFGEALYAAYQQDYFDALKRLDIELAEHYGVDEPELDTLQYYIHDAEFKVGDFELRYRMHRRAGRAMAAVIDADVAPEVRNDAVFRLARLQFQKEEPSDALKTLEKIDGPVPDDIRDDVEFLRANVLLALHRPSEAIEVLRRLQGSESLEGFAAYNLGIALLQAGETIDAVRQLDRAGTVGGSDQATLAIRDKSNLVLGTLLFESSEFGLAQRSLDRVRLAGPFSNQALLRAGWADLSAEKFERALVPWSILSGRDATDAAVQEALLALPYAYSRLNVHGRAAVLYEQAVRSFGNELEKVDASIASIRRGDFLKALVREEIRHDEDWVVRLRNLPDAPETFYLVGLMASHEFQTGLQNYLDLEDLRKRLAASETSFDAFEDMIRLRRRYYEPLLPEIDRQFRQLDARMRLRLEQRQHLDERLQHMLIAPRPDLLATADEQRAEERIGQIEVVLPDRDDPQLAALRRRIARLKGVLSWNLETRYHERLTSAYEHLRELDADVDELRTRYESFVRMRQAATHSYVGYDDTIVGLRRRVAEALERVGLLMARQGHMLETVAVAELTRRRDQIEGYQNQARFAFADSYDRAVRAQSQ